MVQVWRLNLNTGARPGVDPRAFCFTGGLLGVGWPIEPSTSTWPEYEAVAKEKYRTTHRSWWPALHSLRNRMRQNDLCWSRDRNGIYHLARVTGEWEYCGAEQHRAADVVNFRRCTWLSVGHEGMVPGRVAVSFALRRTLQKVGGAAVGLFSQLAYNAHAGEKDGFRYNVTRQRCDIFSLLSPEDCEDVIALYLQICRGYSVVPSTCRRDTPSYEFVLINRETGDDAVLQVKSGAVDLEPASYSAAARRVFLFSSRGRYRGSVPANVECLDPATMITFVDQHERLLPNRLQQLARFSRGEV